MNKDRRITLISIMIWAIAVIALFAYYKIINPDAGNKKNENSTQATSESGGVSATEDISSNNPYVEKANQMLAKMNLSEKVGQMFFVRCPENNASSVVADYNIGAYILFARDFEGKKKETVKANIQMYQSKAKIPLLIGVDEEGGTVTRISRFTNFRSTKFKSPQEIYSSGGMNAIRTDTQEKCQLLSGLGINVNFAPVCDIATDTKAFIYDRTLGKDATETSDYITEVVKIMEQAKVGSVLKHFPGYGNNKDTHVESSTDDRSLADFKKTDFLPFKAGIEAGSGCVLVSHNVVKAMDPENPASLSEKVHQILRNELGFEGVIITDDLVMDAISGVEGVAEAAVKAVLAGNDMLISSEYDKQISAVVNAVNDGRIPSDIIDKAVVRVLCWKMSLGIIKDN